MSVVTVTISTKIFEFAHQFQPLLSEESTRQEMEMFFKLKQSKT